MPAAFQEHSRRRFIFRRRRLSSMQDVWKHAAVVRLSGDCQRGTSLCLQAALLDSKQLQVCGHLAAIAAFLQGEADLLVICKTGQP